MKVSKDQGGCIGLLSHGLLSRSWETASKTCPTVQLESNQMTCQVSEVDSSRGPSRAPQHNVLNKGLRGGKQRRLALCRFNRSLRRFLLVFLGYMQIRGSRHDQACVHAVYLIEVQIYVHTYRVLS